MQRHFTREEEMQFILYSAVRRISLKSVLGVLGRDGSMLAMCEQSRMYTLMLLLLLEPQVYNALQLLPGRLGEVLLSCNIKMSRPNVKLL